MGKAGHFMIKGVNKRVVEITGTDSEYFEKAVLYIKSDKSGLPAERLNEEAREYLDRLVPVRRRTELSLAIKLIIAAAAILLTLLVIYCLTLI